MKSREVRHALLGLFIVLGLFLPLTVGSQDRAIKALGDPLTAATGCDGLVSAGFQNIQIARRRQEERYRWSNVRLVS